MFSSIFCKASNQLTRTVAKLDLSALSYALLCFPPAADALACFMFFRLFLYTLPRLSHRVAIHPLYTHTHTHRYSQRTRASNCCSQSSPIVKWHYWEHFPLRIWFDACPNIFAVRLGMQAPCPAPLRSQFASLCCARFLGHFCYFGMVRAEGQAVRPRLSFVLFISQERFVLFACHLP